MEANLVALADRIGINTMVDLINRTVQEDGYDITSFQKELYYDSMMLEKIKIGQENYVFLKYAKPYSIPKGHGKWTIRKNFPLTEHTTPLLEGIPPKSDKMRKERIEGAYHQYGRYMEFSDRVDWKLLDPVIMEYASEYGDVATRTMHRLARKELLSTTFKVFANDKVNIGELVIGDYVGLADFRLAALKMARLAVKPIGAVYHVITSEEHYWDLMKDPLILEYIGTNNGLAHYASGEIPELFKIKFIKTQMDDFAYGYELGNPGEYNDGADKCRIYFLANDADEYFYTNVNAATNRKTFVSAEYRSNSDFIDGNNSRSMEEGLPNYFAGTSGVEDASETNNRLSDGSWIPIRNIWTFGLGDFGATDVTKGADVTDKTEWGSLYYTYDHTGGTEEKEYKLYVKLSDDTYELVAQFGTEDGKLTSALASANSLVTVRQLPVHKAIMLGEGALAKLDVTGEGNVKMYAKEKGSAGVLDPINQRQSIGFKINTLGFKLIREESCWVFHHVPTQAPATAGISLGNLTGSQTIAMPR